LTLRAKSNGVLDTSHVGHIRSDGESRTYACQTSCHRVYSVQGTILQDLHHNPKTDLSV